jgi:hypothetical protein
MEQRPTSSGCRRHSIGAASLEAGVWLYYTLNADSVLLLTVQEKLCAPGLLAGGTRSH